MSPLRSLATNVEPLRIRTKSIIPVAPSIRGRTPEDRAHRAVPAAAFEKKPVSTLSPWIRALLRYVAAAKFASPVTTRANNALLVRMVASAGCSSAQIPHCTLVDLDQPVVDTTVLA